MGEDLPKFPLPLIIIRGLNQNRPLGVGATLYRPQRVQRRFLVKVSVYKEEDGGLSVLVQGSVGKGRSPVLLKGLTLETLRGETRPVVDAMRLPKQAK